MIAVSRVDVKKNKRDVTVGNWVTLLPLDSWVRFSSGAEFLLLFPCSCAPLEEMYRSGSPVSCHGLKHTDRRICYAKLALGVIMC